MCGVTPTFQKTWQNKSPSPRHKHIPNSSFVFFLNWNIYNTIYFSNITIYGGLAIVQINAIQLLSPTSSWYINSYYACYRLCFRMGRHSGIKSSSHRDFFFDTYRSISNSICFRCYKQPLREQNYYILGNILWEYKNSNSRNNNS